MSSPRPVPVTDQHQRFSATILSWYQNSDKTAFREYGVTRDFVVDGIRAGKLEVRDGAIWSNPYLRVFRSRLEAYIAERLGAEHLATKKAQTELRAITKEIADTRSKLKTLEARQAELEHVLSSGLVPRVVHNAG
jgi:hypothetical protein